MTKTLDEQLERMAFAQERSADALENILAAISSATVSVRMPENHNAGIDTTATKEAGADEEEATAEAEAEAEPEVEAEAEPEPTEETEPEPEATAEAAADESDDGGDPLGDGDAASEDKFPLPAKLTNDTLRGFARHLMDKDGKAAVFEVLAEVGTGYKAVGEVTKDDLKEAHLKMAARLNG
jgi:hypothetical protein